MGGQVGIRFMYIKSCHSLGDLQIESIHLQITMLFSIIALRKVKLGRIVGCFQNMPVSVQVPMFSQVVSSVS